MKYKFKTLSIFISIIIFILFIVSIILLNKNNILKIKVQKENVKIEKYIYNMEEIMSASDIAVCRSGALTITELGIIGVPSILIPLPTAAENHQYYNAKTIEDTGAVIIIEEKDLNKESLENAIREMLNNKEKLKNMKQKAIKKENVGAIDKIMEEVNKLTK